MRDRLNGLREKVAEKVQDRVATKLVNTAMDNIADKFRGADKKDESTPERRGTLLNDDREGIQFTKAEKSDNNSRRNPKDLIEEKAKQNAFKTAALYMVVNLANLGLIHAFEQYNSIGLTLAFGINLAVSYKLHEFGSQNAGVLENAKAKVDGFFKPEPQTMDKQFKQMAMHLIKGGAVIFDQFIPAANNP